MKKIKPYFVVSGYSDEFQTYQQAVEWARTLITGEGHEKLEIFKLYSIVKRMPIEVEITIVEAHS